MPELPEVETVRASLERAGLQGPVERVYRSSKALRTGSHYRPENLRRLRGQHPVRVWRRGKFLLVDFRTTPHADPSHDDTLLVHLGMSGQFVVTSSTAPLEPHTHVRLTLADARELRFVDPRRFGAVRVTPRTAVYTLPPLQSLGPEPLDAAFNGAVLASRARRSKRAIRDVLLDQTVVAGVGNIYVSEALFVAGVHPLVSASRLGPQSYDALARAVTKVLRGSLEHGGTTLRDYRDADGNSGENQHHLMVYGRADEPCRLCGTPLRGFVHGGRSGVYCPTAQPRRRRWP